MTLSITIEQTEDEAFGKDSKVTLLHHDVQSVDRSLSVNRAVRFMLAEASEKFPETANGVHRD